MGHLKTKVLCCTSGGSWRQRSMTFYFNPYLGIRGQKWFLTCSWFNTLPNFDHSGVKQKRINFSFTWQPVFGRKWTMWPSFWVKMCSFGHFSSNLKKYPSAKNVFSLKMEMLQKLKLSQKLTIYTCYISLKVWHSSIFGLKIRLIYINFDENWHFFTIFGKKLIFWV